MWSGTGGKEIVPVDLKKNCFRKKKDRFERPLGETELRFKKKTSTFPCLREKGSTYRPFEKGKGD